VNVRLELAAAAALVVCVLAALAGHEAALFAIPAYVATRWIGR
jgi:hypothetical protein